jgi:hypothetical protein
MPEDKRRNNLLLFACRDRCPHSLVVPLASGDVEHLEDGGANAPYPVFLAVVLETGFVAAKLRLLRDRRCQTLRPRVVYSTGIKHLAERAKSYWLIDAVTSYFGTSLMKQAIAKDPRIGQLHFWTLTVSPDDSVKLTAQVDTNEKPLIVQAIECTDFPLRSADIWAAFDGHRWTLLLPSEY